MFTSCGWFHDELSGIETVQCLQYAARAMHLARQFHRDFEPEFVAALEEAPSNVSRYRDGRGVWEQMVRPGMVDLDRVLAHHAISLIFGHDGGDARSGSSRSSVETIDPEVRRRGGGHLAVGGLAVRSLRTRDQAEARFVVLHFGGLDFHAVLSQGPRARGRSIGSRPSFRDLSHGLARGRHRAWSPGNSPAGPTGSTTCSATSSGGSSASCWRTGSPTTAGRSSGWPTRTRTCSTGWAT